MSLKFYSVFNDFGKEAISVLSDAGIEIDVHPQGISRPDYSAMKRILEEYDCVIIGTSQKITEDMFDNVNTPKIIATASVGLDHIQVPDNKKELVRVINTPKANAQSVAEYTIGCALACCKRLEEGGRLYKDGKDNKSLSSKPEDLAGKTMGVIGAGNVSAKIMDYADFFGMNVMYWTAHPEKHDIPYRYCELNELIKQSDVISVNLPNKSETQGIISEDLVSKMKSRSIFISVSRLQTINLKALVDRSDSEANFYVNVDIDIDEDVINLIDGKRNVFVTPHIAGGTAETRRRMFLELAHSLVQCVNKRI